MTQSELLKFAYEMGYQQAFEEALEKQAISLAPIRNAGRAFVGKARGLFGRGAEAGAGALAPVTSAEQVAARNALGGPNEAIKARQRLSSFQARSPNGTALNTNPLKPGEYPALRQSAPAAKKPAATPAQDAKLEPAKPESKAKATPAATAEKAPAEAGISQADLAHQVRGAHGAPTQEEYIQKMKDLEKNHGEALGKMTEQGAVNPLLSWGAPVALGAGGGYLLDDRQGAMTGAGLALGARAGLGPALARIAENRGAAKALGEAMPTLGESIKTLPKGEATKAMMLAGGLGAGGAVAGHYLGKGKKKEPWYNQLLGLTPLVASAAVPYLAAKGSNPQLIAQLQGLTPASPMSSQIPAGYPADDGYGSMPPNMTF